jgi:phospholipid/cholesterol/gamma-HCH transport system substrate-binding protein
VAALFVLMLVAATLLAVRPSLLQGGGYEVQAEFADAFPLLEGNAVRVSGAVAGEVKEIELTDRGTSIVTMRLHDGLPRPRADASASVRAEDLLGDNYLSLSLGSDRRELHGAISAARTNTAPRLDEVMTTFRPSVRAATRAMLGELGIALERRGVDLNRALVELRPALAAADGVMGELGSQNADLRTLIRDTERVTRQAAPRHDDLGRMLHAFAATLDEMSAHRDGIERALDAAPSTLIQARGTLARLTRTAEAATPLARSIGALAPDLGTSARLLGPFLADVTRASQALRPTARLARRFLVEGGPSFAALDGGLRSLGAAAPPLDDLMRPLVRSVPALVDAQFNAERNGVGERPGEATGLGATAVERGNQLGDPFSDPDRYYNRARLLVTCQSFGLPIEPGCLDRFLEREQPGSTSARALDFLLGP